MLRYYDPAPRNVRGFETDICIYGGTSAAIAAAISALKLGRKVAIVAPERQLGGMTAGGLSLTDSGNQHVIGGCAREFYRAAGRHYGVPDEWKFEPHVAAQVFAAWLKEYAVPVYPGEFLQGVTLKDGRIEALQTESGLRVKAAMFIDATYEGDLLAAAGAHFTVGREGNQVYGELLNGMQIREKHQFEVVVDPYNVPGVPGSGLLPGIETGEDFSLGRGDQRIQAYNFRMCLTRMPGNRIPFVQPPGYQARQYELLGRYLAAGWREVFHKFDPIRGHKTDTNNHGAVSTDFIGQNHAWPLAGPAEREKIFQAHVVYQQGLQWFLANDPRVPRSIREDYGEWGLPRDEFVETDGWPHQLYIREARRLRGDVVMTEHHCRGYQVADDSVGLGAYAMDSHNCRRLLRGHRVLNEGDVQCAGFKPYPISYRAIIPRRGECANLLVPVCVSASHIAYGSIRMEPVFMILGQSAAVAAALAIGEKCAVQDLPYPALRAQLLATGAILAAGAAGDAVNEIV